MRGAGRAGPRAARLGALASAALAACALSAPGSAGAFTPEQEAQMAVGVEKVMVNSGYPGIAVGVWSAGQGSFTTARGVADARTGRPLTLSAATRVGSITKTFTATVILRLVERGRLSLDDPVKDYLARVPRGREVTIRMLLNHTSGIADLAPGVANAVANRPERNWRPRQVIFRTLRQERLSRPGAEWHYSNANYLMLGEIAREVTGRSLRSLYRREVWRPLNLSGTSFRPADRMPPGAVHGYATLAPDAPFTDTFRWNFSWTDSAGAMASTLGDLRRYAPALATGKGLLERSTQRERLDFVPTGTGLDYGLGIFAVNLSATEEPLVFLGHNGIVPGYDAMMLHAPAAKTTIVILGNTAVELDSFPDDRPHPDFFELAEYLTAVVQGVPIQARG